MEETGIDASGVQALKDKKSGTYIVIIELGSDEGRNVGHHGAMTTIIVLNVSKIQSAAWDQARSLHHNYRCP
jgi:hypothetical protein